MGGGPGAGTDDRFGFGSSDLEAGGSWDEDGAGWGEGADQDGRGAEWYLRERPPHHGE